MQRHKNKKKKHHESKYTVYFCYQEFRTTVKWPKKRIKLRNVTNFSIDKVHCCYFDKGNALEIQYNDCFGMPTGRGRSQPSFLLAGLEPAGALITENQYVVPVNCWSWRCNLGSVFGC